MPEDLETTVKVVTEVVDGENTSPWQATGALDLDVVKQKEVVDFKEIDGLIKKKSLAPPDVYDAYRSHLNLNGFEESSHPHTWKVAESGDNHLYRVSDGWGDWYFAKDDQGQIEHVASSFRDVGAFYFESSLRDIFGKDWVIEHGFARNVWDRALSNWFTSKTQKSKEEVEKQNYKTDGGVKYPKEAYAYTPSDQPSTWKLRLWETPAKKETARQVGLAVAALGKGFRGNRVQIPAKDRPGVVARVRSAWRKTHPGAKPKDMPNVLKSFKWAKGDEQDATNVAKCKVLKATDELQYTLSVAYPLGDTDAHGDTIDDPSQLEKSAWGFMNNPNAGVMHAEGTDGAGKVVESYIYRGPDWKVGDQVIKSGDWLLGIVWDDPAWQGIKSGEFAGLSLQGYGKRVPV